MCGNCLSEGGVRLRTARTHISTPTSEGDSVALAALANMLALNSIWALERPPEHSYRIEKRVSQGLFLSPGLYNVFMDYFYEAIADMRTAIATHRPLCTQLTCACRKDSPKIYKVYPEVHKDGFTQAQLHGIRRRFSCYKKGVEGFLDIQIIKNI